MDKDINAVVGAEKDNEEPAETCFNNELLEFKFLPEDDALISMSLLCCCENILKFVVF